MQIPRFLNSGCQFAVQVPASRSLHVFHRHKSGQLFFEASFGTLYCVLSFSSVRGVVGLESALASAFPYGFAFALASALGFASLLFRPASRSRGVSAGRPSCYSSVALAVLLSARLERLRSFLFCLALLVSNPSSAAEAGMASFGYERIALRTFAVRPSVRDWRLDSRRQLSTLDFSIFSKYS